MQTSFMHPPFGFALFYLRSVAPKEDYTDKITGKRIAKVTIGQIYWGSAPFIVMQIIMVILVLIFPGMVTHYKSDRPEVNVDEVNIDTSSFSGYGTGSLGGHLGGSATLSGQELNDLFE